MFAYRVLQRAKELRQRRPFIVNSLVYGSFYTGAEFLQQTFRVFKLTKPPQSPDESRRPASGPPFPFIRKFDETLGLLDVPPSGPDAYNWPQLRRYVIYGCCMSGPLLHGWYTWLDAYFNGKTMKIVLSKLLADQFILTPPLIVLFFISMSLMEGRLNVLEECRMKFVQTFQTACMYWLPVQFVNFLLVPAALRVTFVSVAAFCWVNILCYLKSMPLPNPEEKKERS